MSLQPFLDIALFVVMYVVWVVVLMAVNAAVLEGRELPAVEYAALWGLFFAPAALVTVIARVMAVPSPGVLVTKYGLSLLAIGVGIEVGYSADLGPLTVAVVEVVVCAVIVGIFRER
jgi:hypothetical protein